jgi:uncharacterized protein YbjT (DUF2867 family)
MARILIVGCGCRGRALAQMLAADGHAVRGTTRDPANVAAITEAGAEPYIGDPDRIATLMEGLVGVTIVCWLAGTATGDPERVAELHGGRLRMLFEKLVDTPVRGVVYEAAGPLPDEVYARGRAIAEEANRIWSIPLAVLDADPVGDHDSWLREARHAVDRAMGLR